MVSVIIATYRREESLERALNSLTKQTYKNFEVVIVDDNADKTWNEKVYKIISKFNGISVNYIKNNENFGSAKSRNIGIDASKGEYITFLDDDDVYLPKKIENQIKQMIDEKADFSITNLQLCNEDDSILEFRKRDYILTSNSKNLLLYHLKYHMTGTDTLMFKRDYLVSFGGFELIDIGDEFYLMVKAIEQGGKLVYCNECDVKAYVHQFGGLSSGKQKIEGENRLFEFKKAFFDRMSLIDKRYIKMRHHAVLAFAYKREGNKIKFFLEGIKAFLISPFQCIKLLRGLR